LRSSDSSPLRSSTRSSEVNRDIYTRNWTTDHKRLLHERRERKFLRKQGKHGYIDFSDSERAELRRYFDALAGSGQQRVKLDKLEDMLISLGVAGSKYEVKSIVEAVDNDQTGELDFEEYLEMVRTRTDSEIFQVFKAMMEGKLGDQNLNFQTVLSAYRRQLMVASTGAHAWCGSNAAEKQEKGAKILDNFAKLQRSRYEQAEAKAVAEGKELEPSTDILPFEFSGNAPLGGLRMMWLGVCHENSFVPRGQSEQASKRIMERPKSPSAVISCILRKDARRRSSSAPGSSSFGHRGTVMIAAPEAPEARMGSKDVAPFLTSE